MGDCQTKRGFCNYFVAKIAIICYNNRESEAFFMRAYERFLRYAVIDTQSDDRSETVPTTRKQFDLQKILAQELTELGASDVLAAENGCTYAKIPATPGYEGKPKLGFIAHIDTSPDCSGAGVKPVLTPNYDGGDLPLGDSGKVLSVKTFPHLASLKGRTLITTDGTTLLGSDDKAGVAEIVTMAERLLTQNVPHGTVCLAFTPDEETGGGADTVDLDTFGADLGYTVDGGPEGDLEYENFNAAMARFEIKGVGVHPGSAKNIMVNAALVAAKINDLLPADEIPARTEGREGFYHLTRLEGGVEEAIAEYIIRDFDAESFDKRQEKIRTIAQTLSAEYGCTVKLTLHEQYRNMAEIIRQYPVLIDNALEAARRCGLEPCTDPIRGGTDGAQLSFRGLPCPNLGTGGYAFHGPYEHNTVEGMDKQTDVLVEIVKLFAE